MSELRRLMVKIRQAIDLNDEVIAALQDETDQRRIRLAIEREKTIEAEIFCDAAKISMQRPRKRKGKF